MDWLPDGWTPEVVVIDIDGTITDDKKRLSSPAVEALRRLEEHGIPVVLATGNVRPVTYGLWRFLGLSAPMCCENGGVVWHPSWENAIVRASGDEAHAAAHWLAQRIDGLDPNGIATNRWRESEWCLFPYEDLEAVQESIASSEWSHLSVIRTGFAIHLMEPHLSKGEGLTVLFEKMGWSMENALCVGDAPNDLSMFEVMRWSVAVGGAFPSVVEAADVRSPFAHGDTFPPLVDAILQRLHGGE
ncbi:MAG: phosphoglycolate phosphatase [Candidatus Poseidoniales archaeon]|nr:MAG: phosphoglycolate phosphatase [Candidatus Poseidoniales archaeon]